MAANPLALTDNDISGIVQTAIGNNSLPLDANGVYFVLTAPGVAETLGFLSVYCGWHSAFFLSGTWIKYSFVGDAGSQHGCAAQLISSPNNDPPVDGMASIIAHDPSETVDLTRCSPAGSTRTTTKSAISARGPLEPPSLPPMAAWRT